MTEIVYELEREDNDGNITESSLLLIEGNYESATADERWGYYGATPGTPEDAEIDSILELVENESGKYCYCNKRYTLKSWNGTFTKTELEYIVQALCDTARENIADAKAEAAIDAYNSRNEY